MWCVASAPIVPLARDLDAALGMQLSELAVPFRKLSTPLPTAPPPLGQHPRFFRKVLCRFLAPFSISSRTHISSTRCPRRSYSLRTCLRASRTCATSRPAARHSLRMATAAMGPFFRKHKKTSTVPWGAVLVLGY